METKMASDKVDLSLDDIIKQSAELFKSRGRSIRGRGFGRGTATRSFSLNFTGGRGGARIQRDGGIGKPYNVNGNYGDNSNFRTWNPLNGGRFNSNFNRNGRLLISNLDFNVNNSDILELFSEFGPLKRSSLHYDANGRSLGTAEVVYEFQADAIKAMNQYNNVPLDGRPMKIIHINHLSNIQNKTPFQSSPTRGNFNRGSFRGNFRGGRGGRGGSFGGSFPSREQLDAQLDAYKMEVN